MDQLETQPWQFASGSNTLGELVCHFFWGGCVVKTCENLGGSGLHYPRGYVALQSQKLNSHILMLAGDPKKCIQKELPGRKYQIRPVYPQATLFVVSQCKDRNANVYLQYCLYVYKYVDIDFFMTMEVKHFQVSACGPYGWEARPT